MISLVWTPLITAANFTGIETDLMTAASGLIGLTLIIVGVGVLYRIFSR